MMFNAIVISLLADLKSNHFNSNDFKNTFVFAVAHFASMVVSFTLHQWSGKSLKKLSRREPQFNYLNEVTEPFFEQRKAAFRFSNE